MRHFNRRVEVLARRYGCPTHGIKLLCVVCDEIGPLPDDISADLDRFIASLAVRVGLDALRAAMVPKRSPPPCPACGGERSCGACMQTWVLAVCRALGLTPEERRQLRALQAVCRERHDDHER